MKLFICIVESFYRDEIETKMKEKGYRMTELSSSGGFLKRGNTTFLFGVRDSGVVELKSSLKDICTAYEQKKGKCSPDSHRFTSFLLDASEGAHFLASLHGK
ncbi:cyclic-di-AMP receptor [Bacillus sp. FJAT-44742]|uniref:cyclic-di-AMP receptor n=1 Tax=Bacillus sp. FJAT-44742 TaxID=2014005 RepID=UPI000C23832E|nr:cyclic-di-AMP receptor [Bacillus sp. FJAT-44742]